VNDQSEDTEIEELTKREGPGSGRARKKPDRLERGTAVGRYIIVGELGSGGMGVVYRAFDPELDRKVAIKLLQADATSESVGGQAWLQREAQAMARLSHPNVIAVYDVGTLPGDRVFVAMELVEGVTLRAWLKAEPRPWRDVLHVMRAAGAGLAAAHASGLVHRDFKPENVLVGNDLRVRVMDFGLARLSSETTPPPGGAPDAEIESRSPLSQNLTMAGTLVGTPAYMAPELRQGVVADARSDQFSFGVALYEGLFRIRPYGKDAPAETKPKSPPESKVPAHLQRVVMRAIAPDPADRFASMDELLAELGIDLGARRRRVLLTAGGLAIAALAVGGGFALSSRHREEVCTGFDARFAGVWDAPVKLKIKTAFDATKRPFAAKSYESLTHSLDDYSNEWISTAVDSCKATRVRGEQNEEALSLRQSCLDRRLEELRALAQVLTTADAELVENADKLPSGLEPLHRCSNVAALRAPGLAPSEPADKVDEEHQLIAEAKAELIAGRLFPSLNAAKKAERLADELHYTPWKAEVLIVEGATLTGAGSLEESAAACQQGVWAAIEGHRDDIAAAAALCAAATAAQHQIGEARIWVQLARTFGTRLGTADPEFEVRVLEVEGLIEATSGDLSAAIVAQQKALTAAEHLMHDKAELWRDEEVIGTTYARAGAYDKSIPHLERAIALHEAEVGPDHPNIAAILTTLGAAYSKTGQNEKSSAAYQRALAIREKTEGLNSPALVVTLNNMADGLIKSGDTASALVYLDRAKELADKSLGDVNPLTQAVAVTRAEALAAQGRYDDSRSAYDAVIAIETKNQSGLLGQTLGSRVQMELSAKHWSDAATFAQRAIAVVEKSSGKDSPDLWQPLAGLARADIELGHKPEARPLLERSIAIAEKAQVPAPDLEPVRKLLAGLDEKKP
jgi:tetratricopeptide (TPR) repeat protein